MPEEKQTKNIVICLDGTGNQVEENISNVLKLYRALKKNETQIVYYDQGVGTLGRRDSWARISQWFREKFIGMGFGLGLDKNVLQAYEFLACNYVDGDQIYLFGFSRGAHTARVLAGMLYVVGLLRPEQLSLCGAALTAYKQSDEIDPSAFLAETEEASEKKYEGEGANFRRVMKPRTVAIEFMGLWDTVSSVFIPNYRGLFFPPIKRDNQPHTSRNPAVKKVCHAVSIDEKRRFFRLDKWPDGQVFKPNFFSQGTPPDQINKQVWFAGYHSDVGGGQKKDDSGLSQFSLIWMFKEAEAAGIKTTNVKMVKYVTGQEPYSSTTKYHYPEPKVTANTHKPHPLWRLLEIFPKSSRHKDWKPKRELFGFYIPLFEPRTITEDDVIHPSALEKRETDDKYDPVNLP